MWTVYWNLYLSGQNHNTRSVCCERLEKTAYWPTTLKLFPQVNTVDSAQKKVLQQFPTLFKGLGTIEGEYDIQLRKDARPYALATPRRIPLPLKGQVEELNTGS